MSYVAHPLTHSHCFHFCAMKNKSQIQMQTTSPVPRNSPLTVTTTTRYETSSRNHVSSPRNYSLSPTSQIERASPVNYVPASTQRIASPINMQRVTSPITTITHRVTTPLTSPLTVKVILANSIFSGFFFKCSNNKK